MLFEKYKLNIWLSPCFSFVSFSVIIDIDYQRELISVMRSLALFKNVSPDTLDMLVRYGKIKEYPKGSILIRAKESQKYIYIQVRGKSIVYNLTHTGKRKVLFIFGPGMLLNDHVLNEHPSAIYCETIEKSKIFMMPFAEFVGCMERDFTLTRSVVVMQERKMWRLAHQLKNTTGSIAMERKLAAKLWKLSRDFGIAVPEGIEIDMNLSVTFLADMLGTPRETASRLCRTLIDYGLIKMNNKRIIIINPQKMSLFYKTGEVK